MDSIAYSLFLLCSMIFIWFSLAVIVEVIGKTITAIEIMFCGSMIAISLTIMLWSILTLIKLTLFKS